MAKAKSVFFCTECGNETPKWAGRCPSCGSWNTMNEDVVAEAPKAGTAAARQAAAARPEGVTSLTARRLSEISTTEEKSRILTGISELDRVLGGGIVIGSEMSGGVKDMVVTQCLMDHTDRGLRVKTRRGRGNTAVIDGLVFRNVEMRGVKAPFVINMFYFCDPDGHGPYVQCRDAMPVDEYTPKLGSLTMEDIVATDAQFAGCYFDGLPEQPIERVSMKNVTITFDPNAEAGQAAMADNRPLVKKLAIYAENVKEIDLHNVKIEGYEGERLHFVNVGHFEED